MPQKLRKYFTPQFLFSALFSLALLLGFPAPTHGAEEATYNWAKTTGGTGYDGASDVAVDVVGNQYIVGEFTGTVDFDPGVGLDNQTATGRNTFLSKYASDGTYQWTKVMGGASTVVPTGGVVIDQSGDIFISGGFQGTIDFDPSGATDNYISTGSYDIFLTKFLSDGSYAWTKTMGAAGWDYGYSIAIDSSGVYIGGDFTGTVDFDPGAGTDNHTSNLSRNSYFSKFAFDGSYQWTKTLGGDSSAVEGIASDGNAVYITGSFYEGTTDFDPGAGTDNYTSNGLFDVFFSKYSTDGAYQWTKTVGGMGWDYGYSIAIDTSGDVYFAGGFSNTVDFDPSGGVDIKNEVGDAGEYDVFLSKYSSSGTYLWTNTVGGTSYEEASGNHAIAFDSDGNIYWTGVFDLTVDFDTSVGIDEHTSNGLDPYNNDIFLTSYDSDGNYRFTQTWGGTAFDDAYAVAIFNNTLFVVGNFRNTVDFDPGAGTDNHTSNGSGDIYLSSFTLPTAPAEEALSDGHNKYYPLYQQYKKDYKNPGSKKKHTELKLLKRTNLPEFNRLKAVYHQYRLSGATYRKTLPQTIQDDYHAYRKYRGYKQYLSYKEKANQ